MGYSHGYDAAGARPELHTASVHIKHRLPLEHVEARLVRVQVRVDVSLDERDQRECHVRRSEGAADEPAGRQTARAARQGVGELDIFAADEAIAGHPVRQLTRACVRAHRVTPAGSTTAEAATASARSEAPSCRPSSPSLTRS